MDTYNLDHSLIEFITSKGKIHWRVRDACNGVQIFGGIGSGKTSSSGRTLSIRYLLAGWGGLILTVKPDELNMWRELCQLTGREQDLIVLENRGQHFFNFLEYESAQATGGASFTDNLVEVIKTVVEAGQEQDSGRSNDAFWADASDSLLINVIDLVKLAYGHVTVQGMYDIVQSIPKKHDVKTEASRYTPFYRAFETARLYVLRLIDNWRATLSHEENIELNDEAVFDARTTEAIPEARLLKQLDEFFNLTYISLNERTRSIIDFSFSGFLLRLLRDPVYSLFCRHKSTFSPEDSLKGKIILINLPVKLYNKVGQTVQVLFKYIWQRAMERRDITQNGRPVFLWADEAQNFIHAKDTDFQATARSSRVATVYITQNLPNYYACMGGHKSEYRVKSYMGTLATKIFHANADIETNRYGSELIGDGLFEDNSESTTISESFSQTQGRSFRYERIVRPEQFVKLKCGGPLNN